MIKDDVVFAERQDVEWDVYISREKDLGQQQQPLCPCKSDRPEDIDGTIHRFHCLFQTLRSLHFSYFSHFECSEFRIDVL